MPLTKEQRNAIFELIQESDLSLSDFEPPEEQDDSTWLKHNPTGSTCSIGDVDDEGDRLVTCRVGRDPSTDKWVEEDGLMPQVAEWLERVELYFHTPDLWEEFARQRESLTGPVPSPMDNSPFTADEQAEIETRLREINEYAAETGAFDDDQLRILNAKIDYLIESAKHSRRFDWREQMVGALVGAAVGNLLPQHATIDVLNTIVGTIGHLMGHPVLGLPR